MPKSLVLKGLYVILIIVILIIAFVIYNMFFASEVEYEVELYFSDLQAQKLIPETRIITSEQLYEAAINELIAGPTKDELVETIPRQAELINAELEDDLLLVDFSEDLVEYHSGGTTGERMTVYSIVNTLTNFSEVNQVQILIEGEKRATLSGHLDIEQPFEFNNQIVNGE